MFRVSLPIHIGDVIRFHFRPVDTRSLDFGGSDFHIWVGGFSDGERNGNSPAHSPERDALDEQDCLSVLMLNAESIVLLERDALGIKDGGSRHTAVRSNGRFAIPLNDDRTISIDSQPTGQLVVHVGNIDRNLDRILLSGLEILGKLIS